MSVMQQIETLKHHCDSEEMEMVEAMIFNAGKYVDAVVTMVTTTHNLIGRDTEEHRNAVSSTDQTRTINHNAFITMVDVVNRICVSHDLPPIYTGDAERRSYGDFALEITMEIFNARQ